MTADSSSELFGYPVITVYDINANFIQALLEGCCGEEVIHINEHGEFKLDVESHAIIQDVKLLQELLLDWKIWNKAEACDVYFYFICVLW